jgi:hypothetical protein
MAPRPAARLRWQAFSATAGYSTGALFGGSVYELGGFGACAWLQLSLCASLAVLLCGLPVVHAAFRARWRRGAVRTGGGGGGGGEADGTVAVTVHSALGGAAGDAVKTLAGTTGRFWLPVSLVLLCDGFNIFSYVTEWALFAVYYKEVFEWSSAATGAAQMSGDLLAAAILALTTTGCWAQLTRAKAGAQVARRLDRMLLQPPWNLGIFFALYTAFFLLLVQPAFGASVAGQVCMGTVFVLVRQATQECYLALSHGCLPLYRRLQFLGSATFNVCMSAGSIASVVVYEQVGQTAPFYFAAALCGGWALCVVGYFLLRYRGRLGLGFGEAEAVLLEGRKCSRAPLDGVAAGEEGAVKEQRP